MFGFTGFRKRKTLNAKIFILLKIAKTKRQNLCKTTKNVINLTTECIKCKENV